MAMQVTITKLHVDLALKEGEFTTMYAGQTFDELVNQGQRECVVIAENGTKFLYEYEMPNGTSCVRNERGKPISYRSISRFWLRLIEDQWGLDNLLARPQQSRGCQGARLIQELKDKLVVKGAIMNTGLLVSVYRAKGSDCTNGGVSSKFQSFILTGEEVSGPFEPTADCPELVLKIGPANSLRAVPRALVDSGSWVMFGGNFVYTSDSRFPSDAPIKIFDRTESYEQSIMLSK